MRIGVIVGSLSSTSINRVVARTFPSIAPEGVEFVYLDFTALPFYSQDAEADFPAAARDWKDSIAAVDGVIIVTPEYSRSLPGALKNALDWAARPYFDGSFNGKPVAIMGVSGGPQAPPRRSSTCAQSSATTTRPPWASRRRSCATTPRASSATRSSTMPPAQRCSASSRRRAAHVALHTREFVAA